MRINQAGKIVVTHININYFGADCGEEYEKAKKARGTKTGEPALDIHAYWFDHQCYCQHSYGGSHSLAGDSIPGMGRGRPLGAAFWRINLGNFLWQYPDQQVLAQIKVILT